MPAPQPHPQPALPSAAVTPEPVGPGRLATGQDQRPEAPGPACQPLVRRQVEDPDLRAAILVRAFAAAMHGHVQPLELPVDCSGLHAAWAPAGGEVYPHERGVWVLLAAAILHYLPVDWFAAVRRWIEERSPVAQGAMTAASLGPLGVVVSAQHPFIYFQF